MTREEIIKAANACGITGPLGVKQGFRMFATPNAIVEFAEAVAAAEREACAKLLEAIAFTGPLDEEAILRNCAAMIRSRGEL